MKFIGDGASYSEEMQVQRFEETAQVPTNLTVGESEAVKADEVAAVIVNEIDKKIALTR